MIKFLKIFWYLSILVISIFFISFEGYRIFDYIQGDYTRKKMNVKSYSYYSDSARSSIIVEGYIDNEEVYFYEYDDDMKKLHQNYPIIFSTPHKHNILIDVFKFKHSKKVLLITELYKWEKKILLFSLYIFISLLIISINLLIKKNEK